MSGTGPPDRSDGEEQEQDGPAGAAPAPRRLDPASAAMARATARAEGRPVHVEPVIDTRRYQWMVGIIGIGLFLLVSIYLLISHGISSPGLSAGERMHNFVAPLATSAIDKPANAAPRCDPADPNPKALNVCGRTPIVLDFFITSLGSCVSEVDTLNRLAPRFRGIQFAAVGVNTSLSTARHLERTHHWTIPIAVDSDGRVGEVYGVEVCPMIYIARAGGVVVKRLIGDNWLNSAKLASQVRLLGG